MPASRALSPSAKPKPASAGAPASVPESALAPYAGPRSLMRVLRILDTTSKAPEGLSLAQISTLLAAPKSSLLLLLRALVSEGYLSQTHNVYSIGSQSYRLASSILSGRKLGKLMRPFMEDLARRTNETVILSVMDRNAQSAIYVDVIDSPHLLRYSVRVGVARPLYCTSGGRVLLAGQDEAWRKAYISKVKLERLTPEAISDRKAFALEIERIHQQGYAICDGQSVPGGAAVGAPIFSLHGEVVAALAVACPSERLAAEKTKLIADVREIAQAASGLY